MQVLYFFCPGALTPKKINIYIAKDFLIKQLHNLNMYIKKETRCVVTITARFITLLTSLNAQLSHE